MHLRIMPIISTPYHFPYYSQISLSAGQKLEKGVNFSAFKVDSGQKLEKGVDFSNNFTPSRLFWPSPWDFSSSFTPNSVFWPSAWDFRIPPTPSRLFWPQTTTGWLSITLQPIQSLYSRPFPILLLKFSPKTEGCHKSQGPWHPYR